MSKTDVRKLKNGDRVRLKSTGVVLIVTGREESGRIVYGCLQPGGAILSFKAEEVRHEDRGN